MGRKGKGKGRGDRVLVVKANSRAASGHTSAPVALLWHCYRDHATHEAVDTKDASTPLTLVGTENPPPPSRYYGAISVWLALILHFSWERATHRATLCCCEWFSLFLAPVGTITGNLGTLPHIWKSSWNCYQSVGR